MKESTQGATDATRRDREGASDQLCFLVAAVESYECLCRQSSRPSDAALLPHPLLRGPLTRTGSPPSDVRTSMTPVPFDAPRLVSSPEAPLLPPRTSYQAIRLC